ncbi:MAG TPA: hypothetical protein VMQ76_12325 [Terracidiphilus sp.]|nr:hypothetical protein [Terracidiphilus sp.]
MPKNFNVEATEPLPIDQHTNIFSEMSVSDVYDILVCEHERRRREKEATAAPAEPAEPEK